MTTPTPKRIKAKSFFIISWDCGTYTDHDVIEAANQDEANKIAKDVWLDAWENEDHWWAEPFNLRRAVELDIDEPESYAERRTKSD